LAVVGGVAVAGVVEGLEGGGALAEDVEVSVAGGAEERLVPHVVEVLHDPVAPGFTQRREPGDDPEVEAGGHHRSEG
jgi:hypothetical protein